ncbi:hypothetical protein SLEP1_g58952 [Rubroshorea leprosula]|uniref:Uncharacterized protein n=1 Tax=Rubroshorea leprosula TaxID=152421 RepID=A0AAV5MS41_9ROSI|nr:hypothetical protein SLEP1_g58952 [Rubroshorea leprosula]
MLLAPRLCSLEKPIVSLLQATREAVSSYLQLLESSFDPQQCNDSFPVSSSCENENECCRQTCISRNGLPNDADVMATLQGDTCYCQFIIDDGPCPTPMILELLPELTDLVRSA